jgi:hypothetical protein
LRNYYKALRELEFKTDFNCTTENINIASLCENLTTAFDVFTSASGVNFIYCGNMTSAVHSNTRLLTKAFLNLLSNAFLYGNTKLVTVKTFETDHHVQIEVQNGGKFPLNQPFGKGLNYVQQACKYMDGQFLIESKKDSSKAIMCFTKANTSNICTDTKYDFINLLSDRLSPVYIEVFGMYYH